MIEKKRTKPWRWVPTLYFSNTLPYVAITTLAMIFYKQLGLNNAEITFYTGWLYLPWLLKPVWKWLVRRMANKRWWLLATELTMGTAFGGVALTIPTPSWLQGTLAFFWLMALACVIHETTGEALYHDTLSEEKQAWFAGIRSICHRLAIIFGQGVLVMFVGNLQIIHRNSISLSWSFTFYIVAGLMLLFWVWHLFAIPKWRDENQPNKSLRQLGQQIKDTCGIFLAPQKRKEWAMAIVFVTLYAVPQGLLSKISTLFLIDAIHRGGLGLSPQEYGLVQGTIGVIALGIGGFMGGLVISRNGLRRWLLPMTWSITFPTILYVYLSYVQPSSLLLISLFVFIQQWGYGFGFTALMLCIMYYCKADLSGRQYVLGTTIMSSMLMLSSVLSGYLQLQVGYPTFFILVFACGLLTILTTFFVKIDSSFGKHEEENES